MKKDGGSAFPRIYMGDMSGMSLRDYWMGQIVPAWIIALSQGRRGERYMEGEIVDEVIWKSKLIVDRMLNEREKE